MKRRVICGVLVVGALLALGCGGAQTRPSRVTIASKAMPEGGSWDGVFQSPAYGRMEFTAAGTEVTGLYEGERFFGKIEGVTDGDVMNFKWTQWNQDLQGKQRSKVGHGYFRYTIEVEQGAKTSHTIQKIDGEWGYDEDNAGNVWNAVKLRDGTKKTLKPHTDEVEGEGGDEYAESAGFNAGSEPSSGPKSEPPAGDSPAVPESSTNNESIDNLF
jgi:hypothetical protein